MSASLPFAASRSPPLANLRTAAAESPRAWLRGGQQQARPHGTQTYQRARSRGPHRLTARCMAAAGAVVAALAARRARGAGWRRDSYRVARLQRAAGGSATSPAAEAEVKAPTSFAFDSQLVDQFLEIAEPYFVPSGPRREGGFGGLLGGLLVGVLSAAFLLFLPACKLVAAVPFLAVLVPGPGAEAKFVELAVAPYVGAAAAGLTVSWGLFWSRREDLAGRWTQWGLLALLVFLLLCVTGINVVISFVFKSLDNVLVAKNEAGFYLQLQLFVAVLVVALPTLALYRFVRLTLARSWRGSLTEFILDRYFQERMYYRLDSNATDTHIDNPDQRISEDVEAFTSETLGFLLDILGSFANLLSFSTILWSTSDQLTYALIGYAFFGTVIALTVGGELIGINYKQLRLQADFRYSLVHVRDNAEAIAFYQGEARERDEVKAKLEAALQNYDQVIKWTTGLTIYQKVFFYVARLVPYFVVGGLYFAGKVDFGTFGQTSFAFSMVLSSVTLIVSRIQDISRFSAGVTRLGSFYEAIVAGALQGGAAEGDSRIETKTEAGQEGSQIELAALSLWTPTGRVLVEALDLLLGAPETARPAPAVAAGSLELPSRLLVVGSSGVGKSSILRAIAGLWTQGRGQIYRPDIRNMIFLPQKPYMPLGDLRTQLLYPSEAGSPDAPSDARLVAMLEQFGLGDLPNRFAGGFEAVEDWARVLSLGEQQRLAAARCLVAEPRVAVLDEATSALPVADERNLYMSLQKRNIGYVSVGHRLSLVEYHDLVLELLGGGRWRVMSPREYEASFSSAGLSGAGLVSADDALPRR